MENTLNLLYNLLAFVLVFGSASLFAIYYFDKKSSKRNK